MAHITRFVFFIMVVLFFKFGIIGQTQLNDGPIRLRIWIHKVWSSANCSDPGEQEYVFRDIRVRPRTDVLGTGWSPSGVNIRANMHENRWMGYPWTSYQVPTGTSLWPMTASHIGILLLDITYPSGSVPTTFDWSIGQTFENDCGNDWIYEGSCGFMGLIGDEALSNYYQATASVSFRSYPEGQIFFVQSDVIDAGSAEDDRYSLIFAVQWDLLNSLPPLPNTCGQPKYKDGPVQLDVELVALWSDVDYDMGSNCIMGLAGDEDLRIRYRSRDNISSFGPSICVNQVPGPLDLYNQNEPEWNFSSPVSLLSKTYNSSDINFEAFEIEFEAWEEDPFPTNEYVYESDDDAYLAPTSTGLINWRLSPPNTWNYMHVPIRASDNSYQNWSILLRYRWIQGPPQIITHPTVGGADRYFCMGSSTTLEVEALNVTFYQWQVADVTGPAGPQCPVTQWTDIAGANCPTFTPPQIPGTKIYRCVLMNRTGPGSSGPTGNSLNVIYSECVKITYFDYSPPISSSTALCNNTVLPNSVHIFQIPEIPHPDAVANANFTWSVTGPAPVTPSPTTGTSTSITFPTTPGTYHIICTVNNPILSCSPDPSNEGVSVCTITVTEADCGTIYVTSNGNPAGVGTISDPVTLPRALQLALSSGGSRTHIKIHHGTYNNLPKLVLGVDNIFLDGDYEIINGEWIKKSSLTTTVNIDPSLEELPYDGGFGTIVGVYKGVEAIGINGFTIQDIEFNVKNGVGSSTANGTTGNRGRSVYGFYFRNCNNYVIRRCVMNTGAGTSGANGINGAHGVNGSDGGNGENGDCDNENSVGDGGAGGYGGGGTWAPGTNVDNSCCNAGQNGTTGGNASTFRNGGGGGSGGSAGSESNNGGSGGNGGNGGGGAIGGNGNGSGGVASGCGENTNRDGRAGAHGAHGINGTDAPSTPPPTSTIMSFYWLPNGKSADGTDGFGGAGGQGGGGGAGQGGWTCVDGAGSGGGGGGGGGQGGERGTGGWGGGSSFAMYMYGAGNGTIQDVTLNSGSAGLGGTRGLGGNGGTGGQGGLGGGGNNTCFTIGNCLTGSRVCGNSEVGAGGRGGNGGNGGRGGHGQPGAPGLSVTTQNVNGSTLLVQNFNPNNTYVLTASTQKGCTNSEIIITKNGGSPFDLPDMGNPDIINDVSMHVSSYSNIAGPNTLLISYSVPGRYKMTLNSFGTQDWHDFINITENRPLPQILGLTDDTICTGNTIDFHTDVSGAQEYQWQIQQISSPYSPNAPGPNIYAGSQNRDPGPVILINNSGSNALYQIKLRVKDRCCGWSKPVYAHVWVMPDVNPGTIGTDQMVCYGAIPSAILSINDASWGSNSVTYSWEQSTDLVNWFPALGNNFSNGASFQPTQAVTGSTYYRRVVNGGPCGNKYSNIVSITVIPEIFPGQVGNNHDICYNTIPSQLISISDASGGNGVFTYVWQQSVNCNGIWSDIPGANQSSYTPNAPLTQKMCYRRVVINDVCPNPLYSNVVTVNVHPPVHPGIIGSDTVLCEDATTDTIVSLINAFGGFTGFTYQWEQSTNNGVTWTPAMGTPIGTPYGSSFIPQIPQPGQTIIYRRVASNTSCPPSPVISNTVTIQRKFNPVVNLGPDTTGCIGQILTLNAGSGYQHYLWNTLETTSSINITNSGIYSVTVTDQHQCKGSDDIQVNYVAPQSITLYVDSEMCTNSPHVQFSASPSGGVWSGQGILPSGLFQSSVAGAGIHQIIYSLPTVCNEKDTVSIQVNQHPQITLGNDFILCSGDTASLYAGYGYVSYQWNNNETTSSILVTSGGTYSVTVTDLNNCQGFDTVVVTLLPNQDATINHPGDFCISDNAQQLTAQNHGGVWSGNGILPSGIFRPWIAGVGNHQIIYEISGQCGDADTIYVSVFGSPHVDLGADTNICNGTIFPVHAGSGMISYMWNTGDTTQSIYVNSTGIYSVTVQNSNGCKDSDSIQITVHPQRNATINPINPLCSNSQPVQLVAADPGGLWNGIGLSNHGVFYPTTVGAGTYLITYTIPGLCGDSDTIVIVVKPAPMVNLGNDITICEGDTVLLDAGSGFVAYIWNTGSNDQTLHVTTGNTYSVTVENQYQCFDTDSILIVSVSPQHPTILTSGPFCSNDGTVQFTASVGGGTWFGNLISMNGLFVPSQAGPGTYLIIYQLSAPCYESDSVLIKVYPHPSFAIHITNESCLDARDGKALVTFNDSLQSNVLWSTGSLGDSVTNLSPGQYTVSVTNQYGCSEQKNFIINGSLLDCYTPHVFVPNAFSPNGDHENDILLVRGQGIERIVFRIYDRWGEKLFESTDLHHGWDGMYRNKLCPTGIYVYHLYVIYTNGKEESLEGNIALIR